MSNTKIKKNLRNSNIWTCQLHIMDISKNQNKNADFSFYPDCVSFKCDVGSKQCNMGRIIWSILWISETASIVIRAVKESFLIQLVS